MPATEKGPPILEETFKLVDVLSKNHSDINYKFLSPRIASVVPSDLKETQHLLSPNILPLYNDDSGNSVFPVPKLLEATGMSEDDKRSVLQLIMEFSGAKQIAEQALKLLKNAKSYGLDGDISDVTNLITQTFGRVKKSFTHRQKRQIETRHYTFLERHQIEMIFGKDAVYSQNMKDFPLDLDEYERWTEAQKKEALYNKIRKLAEEDEPVDRRRKKRHEGHITLAPYAFSPEFTMVSHF
ncbi:hypothetical protein L596_022254 [Steinernema carpocapsae]|uniref:Uncharacterized protein n=1 Tax=Steinernema carpocapsae TaxID=34508 RepID=A0A4U5MLJ9_STECR|nr:hypothetical protein L596_022254 [Steinernema carpocapsae]